MSAYINSLLIEPVVRQARRFSYPAADATPAASLSHARDNDGNIDQVHDLNALHHVGTPHPSDTLNPSLPAETPPLNVDSAFSREAPGLDIQHASQSRVLERSPVSSPEAIRATLPADPSTNAVHARSPSGGRTLNSLGSMSLDDNVDMTQNPSFGIPHGLEGPNQGSSRQPVRSRSSIEVQYNRTSAEHASSASRDGSVASLNMSGRLPDDDGMRPLREKIHLIREMALSSEDKARKMHDLMMADYEAYRANSERLEESSKGMADRLSVGSVHSPMASLDGISHRSPTPISTTSVGDNDSMPPVSADDRKPTYQPRSYSNTVQGVPEQEATSEEDEEPTLGCKHYQRNVKIQCGDCWRWYTCRHCHDEHESHLLNRKTIKSMLCMLCGHAQKAGGYCEKCGDIAAAYYCDICQLWENDPNKRIYHCEDCGICRRGEGLGKDFVHCKKCNVCIAIAWITKHRCVERATECDCPICNNWMFTSSAAVVAMQCGHYIHRKCYDDYMQTSYKCPICNRSAVNMELQWRKLDQAIEAQRMPSQFSETKAWISCNDCSARSCTSYHWLGNKCTVCDSYNTNYIKLVNSPTDHELEAISSSEEARALRAAEQTIANADEINTSEPSPQAASRVEAVEEEEASAAGTNDIVARSADSPAPTQENLSNSPELTASNQPLPRSPTVSRAALASSPLSQNVSDTRQREDGVATASLNAVDLEENEDEDDEDEDEVGFWGEGISPSSWSMPMGISPMSGWTSPSFFATRMEARNGNANRAEAGEDEGDDDDDDEGQWSTDDSEADEPMEVDEDGDVDDIELLGHR